MKKLLLLLLFVLFPHAVWGATYYFSNIDGDDTRTSLEAQNPSTPWKRCKGMNGVSGNASTVIVNNGDIFLFKSGDIWTPTGAPWAFISALPGVTYSNYGTGVAPTIDGNRISTVTFYVPPSANNVVVRNLRITGAKDNGDGLRVYQAANAVVDSCEIFDSYGNGINYVSGSSGTIMTNNIHDNSRRVVLGSGVLVSSGVQILSSTCTVTRNTIKNNGKEFYDSTNFSDRRGVSFDSSTGSINYNDIDCNGSQYDGSGIELVVSPNVTIENNFIKNSLTGTEAKYYSNNMVYRYNVVTDCSFPLLYGEDPLGSATESTGGVIENNTFIGTSGSVIEINSPNQTIINNIIVAKGNGPYNSFIRFRYMTTSEIDTINLNNNIYCAENKATFIPYKYQSNGEHYLFLTPFDRHYLALQK